MRFISRHAAMSLVASLLASAFAPFHLSGQAPTSLPAPVATFDYDSAAPLDYQEASIPSPLRGVRTFRISYASPMSGRVTGILAVPEANYAPSTATPGAEGPRRPAVLLLHGMPGSAGNAMATWGFTFAHRGAITLSIDAPWARRDGPPLRMTPVDSMEQVQLIQDLRRAVDVLRLRTDVDPQRIGFSGGSYGAAMGALLMGIEPRLATAVLRVGGAGLVSRMTGPDGEPIGELAELDEQDRRRWIAAMAPLEPRHFISGARGRPVFLLAGTTDSLVPADDSRLIHEAAADPKRIEWYSAGHELDSKADADVLEWMSAQLGILAELPEEAIAPAAQPSRVVQDSARVYARWFRNASADSLWQSTDPSLRGQSPEMERDMKEAMQRLRTETGGAPLTPLSERFVWRGDRQQFWQTLAIGNTGRTIVLRLVLLSQGTGGIAGWGWNPPVRTPAVDSAGPVIRRRH